MSGSLLRVDIREVDEDGVPTDTVVATSEAIDYDDITHDSFYQFVFPSTVTLPDSSAVYAIVLYEEGYPYDPIDQSPAGWIFSPQDDPYEEGNRAINDGSWDLFPGSGHFFKVFYSAPTTTTVKENVISFDQSKAKKMFVSTDNTMELDMRFSISICLDGTGTMLWADPSYIRKSEVYLFIRELLLRAPFSYIDVWVFDDTIYENTLNGPTDSRPEYSAAIGSVFSTGEDSRLWAATEQAIGNLDPSSIVAVIIRDEKTDEILELMKQMNRIDYESLTDLDSQYDPASGFEGLKKFGRIVEWLLQEYAETMGREGIVMSDGIDATGDTDPSEIAILANGVMGEMMTPVNFFAMGSTHWAEGMIEVAEATGGLMFEIGEEYERVRESFDILLNDDDHTIFQGSYEDTVEFDEITYIESIEIGVIIPDTTSLTFEVRYTYDGISYSGWEALSPNQRWEIGRFILGFQYRVKAWMGNVWGGNYYEIYGYFPDMISEDGTTVTAGCRYTRYYGTSETSYTDDGDEYYYRDENYPSPKIFSLKYWTISPATRYLFTQAREGGDISQYILVPMRSLPEKSVVRWGVARGDSTDFVDADLITTGRAGVLPNRKSEVYFTPDISKVGLETFADSSRRMFRVLSEDGVVETWDDDDVISVYSNSELIDQRITKYSLIGSKGYVVFDVARNASELITVDIITPGSAAYRSGEICTTNDYRSYFAKNGPWVWDADVTVRVNDSIVRDGFNLSPDQGLVSFHKELDPGWVVTMEIEHSGSYRIGIEIKDYDENDLLDEPDFAFMFQTAPDTRTLYLAGQTNPPEIVDGIVSLSPSSPSLTDRLVVSYGFYQEQGNSDSGSLIRWYRKRLTEGGFSHYSDYDGRNVMRTSDTPALSPGGPFSAYDQWYVIVTPKDVNNEGAPVRSNIVTIGGSAPPYITSATITASDDDSPLVSSGDDLKAIVQDLVADYTYVDPNLTGDQTLTDLSVIQWYRTGDGEPRYTGETLPSSSLSSGDVWYFVVTPYDGVSYGDPVTSTDVIITGEND